MKNVVKIFGIPMSSLGGVHLISWIAQWYGKVKDRGFVGVSVILNH